jgi:hypothetical protein
MLPGSTTSAEDTRKTRLIGEDYPGGLSNRSASLLNRRYDRVVPWDTVVQLTVTVGVNIPQDRGRFHPFAGGLRTGCRQNDRSIVFAHSQLHARACFVKRGKAWASTETAVLIVKTSQCRVGLHACLAVAFRAGCDRDGSTGRVYSIADIRAGLLECTRLLRRCDPHADHGG